MQHRTRAQRARSRRRRRRWTNLQRRRRAVEPLEPRRFLSGTQLTTSTTDVDNKAALLSSDENQDDPTETSIDTRTQSNNTSLPLLTMDKRVLPIRSCPGIDPKLCSTSTVSQQSDGPVRFNLLRVLAAEQLQKNSTSLAIDATFADSLMGTKQFNSFVP